MYHLILKKGLSRFWPLYSKSMFSTFDDNKNLPAAAVKAQVNTFGGVSVNIIVVPRSSEKMRTSLNNVVASHSSNFRSVFAIVRLSVGEAGPDVANTTELSLLPSYQKMLHRKSMTADEQLPRSNLPLRDINVIYRYMAVLDELAIVSDQYIDLSAGC